MAGLNMGSDVVVADNNDRGNVEWNLDDAGLPLLLTAREAAAVCGRALRTWRSWDASGRIPGPIRIGRSTFWRLDELRAWVDAGCPPRDVWLAQNDATTCVNLGRLWQRVARSFQENRQSPQTVACHLPDDEDTVTASQKSSEQVE